MDKDAPFAPKDDHTVAATQKCTGVYGDRRADGSPCCEATYVDGIKDGPARMFYPRGKVYAIENWKDGQLSGPTTLYYESGLVQAELHYKAGQLDGLCKEFFASGNVESEVNWREGQRDGDTSVYDDNGALAGKYVYRRDVLVS